MWSRVCLLVACAALAAAAEHWDVAVAIEDQIEFLSKNGTLRGIAAQKFKELKSIAFDDLNHQIYVSEIDGDNDTIYQLGLTDKLPAKPIVPDLPDDVNGVAVDPVSGVLYWTDRLKRRIMWSSLRDDKVNAHTLFKFDEEIPRGIAVDICKRKLYWTNVNHLGASIECSDLDGTNRKVIVRENMFMPMSISIDHSTNRIYWSDPGEGIYFLIESARLDGTDRKIVYEDTHQLPNSISVNKDYIYWTDLNNKELWALPKDGSNVRATSLRSFNEDPSGIVTRTDYNIECGALLQNLTVPEVIQSASDSPKCLNYGELTEHGCQCHRGYTGLHCEINLCHNYCYNGACYLSSEGYPQCRCAAGFNGTRCEGDTCQYYCLNGGTCSVEANQTRSASCRCAEGFSGSRCEIVEDQEELCKRFCPEGGMYVVIGSEKPTCRCNEPDYKLVNNTQPCALAASFSSTLEQKVKDPLVLGFMFTTVLLIFIILAMSLTMCRLKRRPRIKKRIIVNKNVTPLTCRPNQPTEQCEITIENCCNMNICETPCFEPPQLRGFQCSKKEEKKTLLASMENGEDLY